MTKVLWKHVRYLSFLGLVALALAGVYHICLAGRQIELDREALQGLLQNASLIHIFRKGGPIMWPLLFASILASGTVIDRVLFLLNERRKRDAQAVKRFLAAVGQGDVEGALRHQRAPRNSTSCASWATPWRTGRVPGQRAAVRAGEGAEAASGAGFRSWTP